MLSLLLSSCCWGLAGGCMEYLSAGLGLGAIAGAGPNGAGACPLMARLCLGLGTGVRPPPPLEPAVGNAWAGPGEAGCSLEEEALLLPTAVRCRRSTGWRVTSRK